MPVNTRATVYVPADGAGKVRESGRTPSEGRGVRFVKMEGGRAVFEVGSGSYTFESRSPIMNEVLERKI